MKMEKDVENEIKEAEENLKWIESLIWGGEEKSHEDDDQKTHVCTSFCLGIRRHLISFSQLQLYFLNWRKISEKFVKNWDGRMGMGHRHPEIDMKSCVEYQINHRRGNKQSSNRWNDPRQALTNIIMRGNQNKETGSAIIDIRRWGWLFLPLNSLNLLGMMGKRDEPHDQSWSSGRWWCNYYLRAKGLRILLQQFSLFGASIHSSIWLPSFVINNKFPF